MSDNSRLSSEQALDDYFFDLLDDSFFEEAPVAEAPVSEVSVSEAPVSEAPVSECPVSEAPAVEGCAESAEDADADVYANNTDNTDDAVNADSDAMHDADEHVSADLPRPDDTALSASVGDVNADQEASSTPFDFASLDEEDAPLQPALALSPLEVAPSRVRHGSMCRQSEMICNVC
ncbi:CheW domain protein [Photobacterium aphoticum]|uniref:CheW domain protein n=1 Tax=Photobacterium aphoticum TaxID=754436 RepID=A0A090QZX2_9GAMM|nr:CheW domain protein [Photobacterium aphoticum]